MDLFYTDLNFYSVENLTDFEVSTTIVNSTSVYSENRNLVLILLHSTSLTYVDLVCIEMKLV